MDMDEAELPRAPDDLGSILKAIAHERTRQITNKGFLPEMDDGYLKGELAWGAAAYAEYAARFSDAARADPEIPHEHPSLIPLSWPASFTKALWKPTTQERDLIKAAAMIVAEIQRLRRATVKNNES